MALLDIKSQNIQPLITEEKTSLSMVGLKPISLAFKIGAD